MIQTIYDDHKGNYDYRRIHLELRNRGFVINHKKIQRLMTVMGLAACIRCKRKYSSYKGEIGKICFNVSLKGLSLMRSVIQISLNSLYQTLRRSSIYLLFLMATIVRLLSSPCHAHLI